MKDQAYRWVVTGGWLFNFALTLGLAWAQHETAREAEVKNSERYRWGEAWATQADSAEEAARDDLARRIWVAFASTRKRTVAENASGVTDSTWVDVSSFTAVQLANLNKLVFPSPTGYRVVVFIDTADLARSFDISRRRVMDLAARADQAVEEGRIGDALRNYYWAYLLTHTYIGTEPVDLNWGMGDARSALADRIASLSAELDLTAEPCYRDAGAIAARLNVAHRGRPVQDLLLKYYNGDGLDEAQVRHGTAFVTLYMEPARRVLPLSFVVEYAYPAEMHRRSPDIEELYRHLSERTLNCAAQVQLVIPWVTDTSSPSPPPAPSPPSEPPQPAEIAAKWSVTIQVLSSIHDSQEFRRALQDYRQAGRVRIGKTWNDVAGLPRVYVALLDEDTVKAILWDGDDRFVDTRTGKAWSSVEEAITGQAWVIWFGEFK